MRPNTVKFNEKDIRYYRALKKLTKFLSRHIFLIVLTLAVWSFGYFAFSSWHGNYGDGDGYMRALKIKHWLQSPSFWEQPIYESNYPFGEITHWTRPLDIIWIIISLPFWFLNLPLKETLFLSGAFLSPIIGIVAVLVLVYGLKRRFNIYLTLLGCLIFLCQPSTQAIMAPSRPDHHSLLLLLTTYSFSLVLCWLKKRQDRYLRLLGVTLALATFTVVEGIIIYVLFLSFFLYLFIFKNISLQSAVKISKYFALSVTVFWFLNPPYEGWFYLDTGRLSILYVVASWLTLIGFKILDLSHLHIARLKILSLISMGLGFALAFLVIFGPDVFHSPFSKNIQEIFVGRISEMRSITDLKFSGMLANYTFPLIALILNLILLRNRSYHRLLILNLCLGIPLFIASCLHIRFLHYSIIYCILPFLILIEIIYKKSSFAKHKNADFPGYIWLVIALIFILQIIPQIPWKIYRFQNPRPILYNSALCQQIKNIGGTLLTDIFLSPKLVWNCQINTIGTAYHKNEQGIYDTHVLLNTETDAQAAPLLLRHQITQILLFDNYNSQYYSSDEANKTKLYYRLIKRENIPSYLKEIPTTLPNARLYQVEI